MHTPRSARPPPASPPIRPNERTLQQANVFVCIYMYICICIYTNIQSQIYNLNHNHNHNHNTIKTTPMSKPQKPPVHAASATAPVNIATLKYWGKRDVCLNLPSNSSISVTLSQGDLRTLTSAAASEAFGEDTLWLNGRRQSLEGAAGASVAGASSSTSSTSTSSSSRTLECLGELRALRQQLEAQDPSLPPLSQWKVHVVSENNFPTAAGLASSAAGFAALVVAVARLYELPQSMADLSRIARRGSGSACRSLFGGYVAWEMGSRPDGADSHAVQILPEQDWPQMRALILVVSAERKDTSSTQGMQATVHTSDLFKERITNVVPARFAQMKHAIQNRDFDTFALLTMRDSNSFHATCLDSFPPIFYINDTSKKIIKLCHTINALFAPTTVVAYTFDAGPNAVLYYLEENENKLLPLIHKLLANVQGWSRKFSQQKLESWAKTLDDLDYKTILNTLTDCHLDKHIARVIPTQVGPGPQTTDECLIDLETGLPKAK